MQHWSKTPHEKGVASKYSSRFGQEKEVDEILTSKLN